MFKVEWKITQTEKWTPFIGDFPKKELANQFMIDVAKRDKARGLSQDFEYRVVPA